MHTVYTTSVLVIVLCLAFVNSIPFAEDTALSGNNRANLVPGNEADSENDNLDKRVDRYAFGLGRRAYTYTSGGGGSGVKRLPVYNFGLGKRARPYSFGLGKRADFEDDYADFDRTNYESGYEGSKRNRPYSFGLGKRDPVEDVERRGYPQRYGFGLGKR